MMTVGAAAIAGIAYIAPADSARAVTTVYTASLLVLVPLLLAGIAALLLRRAGAEGRVLVWRATIAALLLVFVGRQLPMHWVAWVVPATLASPLVALGRVQVTSAEAASGGATFVGMLFIAYLTGVAIVLLSTTVAILRTSALARRGRSLGGDWTDALDEARAELGIRRAVRLVVSSEVTVPMTWGLIRPAIVVPAPACALDAAQRRMVLLHELAHVRAGDWAFNLAARLVCALYWFHPGAWWAARGLRDDCELACDDRVIAAGVRRSDYAELLIGAADRFLPLEPALALSRRRGLRARLVAVLDARHDVRPLARGWLAAASLGTLLVAGPMSVVQLAPTRSVLTTLMTDARWESRAWAVLGLASRADSVAVARSAAELDPNPRVRAWARYALGQSAAAPAPLRDVLHP